MGAVASARHRARSAGSAERGAVLGAGRQVRLSGGGGRH